MISFGTAAIAYIHNGAAGHTAQYMQAFCRFVLRLTDDIGKVVRSKLMRNTFSRRKCKRVWMSFTTSGVAVAVRPEPERPAAVHVFRNFQVGGMEVVPHCEMAFVHRNHADDLHFHSLIRKISYQPLGDVENL